MPEAQTAARIRADIEKELKERESLFKREVDRIRKDMAVLGSFASGPQLERTLQACETEYDRRAHLILRHFLRAVRIKAGSPVAQVARLLREEVRKYLAEPPMDLRLAYETAMREMPEYVSKEMPLSQARERALRMADDEIDRHIENTLHPPKQTPVKTGDVTKAQAAPWEQIETREPVSQADASDPRIPEPITAVADETAPASPSQPEAPKPAVQASEPEPIPPLTVEVASTSESDRKDQGGKRPSGQASAQAVQKSAMQLDALRQMDAEIDRYVQVLRYTPEPKQQDAGSVEQPDVQQIGAIMPGAAEPSAAPARTTPAEDVPRKPESEPPQRQVVPTPLVLMEQDTEEPTAIPSPDAVASSQTVTFVRIEKKGQSITMDDRVLLSAALERLRGEVEKLPEVGGYTPDEVGVLLLESRLEAAREHPNRFRLASVGQTIAVIVPASPELMPAYNLFKLALIPFGIVLSEG